MMLLWEICFLMLVSWPENLNLSKMFAIISIILKKALLFLKFSKSSMEEESFSLKAKYGEEKEELSPPFFIMIFWTIWFLPLKIKSINLSTKLKNNSKKEKLNSIYEVFSPKSFQMLLLNHFLVLIWKNIRSKVNPIVNILSNFWKILDHLWVHGNIWFLEWNAINII